MERKVGKEIGREGEREFVCLCVTAAILRGYENMIPRHLKDKK